MVRLVWFPGYIDWDVESILEKYEGKRGRSRSEVICTRFLLGTGRMPHPVGGAMGVTISYGYIILLNIHKTF